MSVPQLARVAFAAARAGRAFGLALPLAGTLGTVGHLLLVLACQPAPADTLSPFVYQYLILAALLGRLVFGGMPTLTKVAGTPTLRAISLEVYGHALGGEPGAARTRGGDADSTRRRPTT